MQAALYHVATYMYRCNRCVVLLQVSEEQEAISYGCTINPINESYCADTFLLPINIAIRNSVFQIIPPLVNLIQ